jgi:putative transposase
MPRQKLSQPVSIPKVPTFTTFDDAEDFLHIPGYQRNLPHWRFKDATYFVTFRLADSIPQEIATRWQQQEAQWLFEHGIDIRWRKTEPDRFHQAFKALSPSARSAFEHEMSRQFFVELDRAHGHCVLRHEEAGRMVAETLQHFHGHRVWTGDFVVMPNHVHVIVQPFEGIPLEEWLYSVKRFAANRLPEVVKRAGHVWQPESFDRVIRDRAELRRTREYIAKNPRNLQPGTFIHHQAEWLDAFL